jgi:hypothetical protein
MCGLGRHRSTAGENPAELTEAARGIGLFGAKQRRGGDRSFALVEFAAQTLYEPRGSRGIEARRALVEMKRTAVA